MSEHRPLLARRLRLWHLVAFDALVAAGAAAAHVSFLYVTDSEPSYSGPMWFGWLIALLSTVPLAVRRLWPMPVLVVLLVGSAVSTALNATREPWIPVACALYIVALAGQRPVAPLVATLGTLAVTIGLNVVLTPQESFWDMPISMLVFVAVVMIATWTSGRAVEARRSYATRSAQQLAHSAVNDERLRIARELHDIVAHSMSLIAVKAGIANHIADQRPEEARDALRVIESTSRSTLNEMRQILGVLRSETSDLAPAPGLSGLPELAERARHAGVSVTMTAPAEPLPSGLELSVYRIVQEALTNVVKHAGPVSCTVDVTASGQEVRISVVDSGPGGTPGSGHGLIGMRERVMMYGGTFSAGPAPAGGFAVSASLPYSA
ncbi:signal transduction histidine kinase [Kibdelosporangium banguiense]|uniref:histidine kinase n=1 Tax=Kibdelosporangium banguiense TaxID=1365924 RepID=A0ABS4TK07_9PSEU|nr:sensor histidine kinase [Kibdelosporangium banguiense]MBP2324696.1 signal transduction histidine kinase [Kibdelosporangium banguiense]